MSFRVGQEVVCVDASDIRNDEFYIPVKNGEVYIISGINPETGNLLIKGCPYIAWGVDVGFRRHRFRPIVKTDTSIFTSMLVPAPKQRVEV